jgi:hypothetical protein
MGPVNAAIVKAKLRELRAQVANHGGDSDGAHAATPTAGSNSSGGR